MKNSQDSIRWFVDQVAGYRVLTAMPEASARQLVSKIVSNKIEFKTVFKDRPKCLVASFESGEAGHLVLKIPKARSRRPWERFLTLFRYGEGVRQFWNMQELDALGVLGPRPMLAAEKRRFGVVTDTFYVYSLVKGRQASPRDLPIIIKALAPIYQQGYCRSDPRVANHIVDGECIYLIDFRITKPWFFGRLRCAMEVCQLAGEFSRALEVGQYYGYGRSTLIVAWRFWRTAQWLRKKKQALKRNLIG
jgi:heptose II phosphotransferase